MRSADLVGRCVLVLGAGGHLGWQAAQALAAAGASVVAADPDLGRLQSLLGRHERILARRADEGDPAALGALIEEFGDLDAVVWATGNGAGSGGSGRVTALQVATCWSVFEQFAPTLSARGGGSLVALCPLPEHREAGRGRPGSWSAVGEVVRECAVHLRPRGVRVNAVLLGEGCSTGVLSFLASDGSAWLTGSALAVQSGWTRIERLVPTQVPA